MPILSSLTWLGIAKETTPGTAVAPVRFLPVRNPKPENVIKMIKDDGFRGRAAKTFATYQGVKNSTFGFEGDAFPDTLGYLLFAIYGQDGTTGTANGTPTTLSTASTIGATTISAAASITANTYIQIDTGLVAEVRQVTAVSGTGPYTLTLDTPLYYAHASGSTVQPLTAGTYIHTFSLAANQPPSWTLTTYDGVQQEQFPGCVAEQLELKFTPDAGLTYTTSFVGFPSATATGAVQTYSTTVPFLGWEANLQIGGVSEPTLVDFTATIKRDKVEPIFGSNNSQTPRVIFASTLEHTGKMTFAFENEAQVNNFLNNTQPSINITLTEPNSGGTLVITVSKASFDKAVKNFSKEYIELEIDYEALFNATDNGPGTIAVTNTVEVYK